MLSVCCAAAPRQAEALMLASRQDSHAGADHPARNGLAKPLVFLGRAGLRADQRLGTVEERIFQPPPVLGQ